MFYRYKPCSTSIRWGIIKVESELPSACSVSIHGWSPADLTDFLSLHHQTHPHRKVLEKLWLMFNSSKLPGSWGVPDTSQWTLDYWMAALKVVNSQYQITSVIKIMVPERLPILPVLRAVYSHLETTGDTIYIVNGRLDMLDLYEWYQQSGTECRWTISLHPSSIRLPEDSHILHQVSAWAGHQLESPIKHKPCKIKPNLIITVGSRHNTKTYLPRVDNE